jgi:hypothetical protein
MSDESIFILLLGLCVGYASYLRLFVIRRLNKKLDKFVDAAVARPGVQAAGASIESSSETGSELRKVQQRLEVLERIAVEKEDGLSRQFAELRER